MPQLKLTSWNVEHLGKRLNAWQKALREEGPNHRTTRRQQRRLTAIGREILEIDPDILCLTEAPSDTGDMKVLVQRFLGGSYHLVEDPGGQYAMRGGQWIRFLVRTDLAAQSSLQPVAIWKSWLGDSWAVNYWGDFASVAHRHYRHPQVLVVDRGGLRVEFIGLHLKSKYVNRGKRLWDAGGEQRDSFIREALKARIKMTTEAANVRAYIDRRFAQTGNPAIFVMGDLNDGPGKEHFERNYLFFDLLSNIQGEVFFARRFLNHALFDYDEDLRWTYDLGKADFVDRNRNPRILLDHILFTQGLVDGSLPLRVGSKAGLVEHRIHEEINAALPKSLQTSDHRPVSCRITG
jgi:endonuclease/exonuclease/phosphatase family metal-dependent hydrolase